MDRNIKECKESVSLCALVSTRHCITLQLFWSNPQRAVARWFYSKWNWLTLHIYYARSTARSYQYETKVTVISVRNTSYSDISTKPNWRSYQYDTQVIVTSVRNTSHGRISTTHKSPSYQYEALYSRSKQYEAQVIKSQVNVSFIVHDTHHIVLHWIRVNRNEGLLSLILSTTKSGITLNKCASSCSSPVVIGATFRASLSGTFLQEGCRKPVLGAWIGARQNNRERETNQQKGVNNAQMTSQI